MNSQNFERAKFEWAHVNAEKMLNNTQSPTKYDAHEIRNSYAAHAFEKEIPNLQSKHRIPKRSPQQYGGGRCVIYGFTRTDKREIE